MSVLLREQLTFDKAQMKIISEDSSDGKSKNFYMEGIFIEGDQENHNKRIYPRSEIKSAVHAINTQIDDGYSVLGEVDHPDDLKINLDRVSHMINKMWVNESSGCGRLKILPTPIGKLIEAMLSSGVKLGVSSRGSGQVNESNGHVSDFEIITVDIVAQPSAPHAYPKAIYESLFNMKGGNQLFEMARESSADSRVQKYLEKAIVGLIKELKI